MAPDQTLDDIDTLPTLEMAPVAGDPTTIPWPDGDLVEEKPLPASIDRRAIEAAAEWAFERPGSQITLSLLIMHRGEVILERYAPGVDMTTRTRTGPTFRRTHTRRPATGASTRSSSHPTIWSSSGEDSTGAGPGSRDGTWSPKC